MDPFSYIIVLTSIIPGLGVTRNVGGLGHLLQTRKPEAQLLGPCFVDAELASAHGPDPVRRLSMARKHALAFSPIRLADASADNLLADRVAPLSQIKTRPSRSLTGRFTFSITTARSFCARFSDRSDRQRPQRLRTFLRARATLRRNNDNVVRSLYCCRVYQTKAVSRLVCRNFSHLQSRFRRHAADHRLRRTRREIDFDNPGETIAAILFGGRPFRRRHCADRAG